MEELPFVTYKLVCTVLMENSPRRRCNVVEVAGGNKILGASVGLEIQTWESSGATDFVSKAIARSRTLSLLIGDDVEVSWLKAERRLKARSTWDPPPNVWKCES